MGDCHHRPRRPPPARPRCNTAAASRAQANPGPDADELKRLEQVKRLGEYLTTEQNGLRDVTERILEKQPGTDRLLLVVDQWEELYTLAEETAAMSFIDALLKTTASAPLSVVLTLRGDFYGNALAHRPLVDRLQDAVVNLGPMTKEELRRAVVKPAEKVGLTYQPGLDNRILDDVGDEPGNLPLLEFVLKGLWEARRGGQLRHAAYETMGGVEGAMAKRADDVLVSMRERRAQGEDKLRRVFLELVHTEEGTKDTRRRIELDRLDQGAQEVVAQLAGERLLVTGRDEATGKETLEIAHEALIRHWDQLRSWLDADREFRTWRHRLAAGLAEWERSKRRDKDTLLRGGPLAEAERWRDERGQDLTDGERDFIQASTKAFQRRNFRNWGIAVAVVFVLTVFSFFSFWQWQKLAAERARRTPIEPAMVPIQPDPKGFMMGAADDDVDATAAERPRHEVMFRKPFAIGKYEVTFDEYDKFSYDTGRRLPSDAGWGGDKRPVIFVSWEDARDYATWLSQKTGKRYRLPTEAEWEYAARSGGKEKKWAGSSSDRELSDYVWYYKNSEGKTQPVGTRKPDGLRLYDMSGNVYEWVEDCWHADYRNAPDDGSARLEEGGGNCGLRVIRGGSWLSDPRYVRSAARNWSDPSLRTNYGLGFRLAQDIQCLCTLPFYPLPARGSAPGRGLAIVRFP